VLGDGALEKNLTVKADKFRKSSKEKIEAVGCCVEVIEVITVTHRKAAEARTKAPEKEAKVKTKAPAKEEK
jgi:ribosomal protein L18E